MKNENLKFNQANFDCSHSEKRRIFLALLIAFNGLIFCFLNISGSLPCESAGCSLFSQEPFSHALWWCGLTAFSLAFLLGSLCLTRRGEVFLSLFYDAARLFLFGDTLLFLLMAFTIPCAACICVGILIFLLWFVLWLKSERRMSKVATVWLLMATVNAVSLFSSFAPLFPVQGDNEAPVSVYFSPSCDACASLIATYQGAEDVAFYPVAENPGDVLRIIALMDTQGTLTERIRLSRSSTNARFSFSIYLKVLFNRLHVLKAGGKVLPFIQTQGLAGEGCGSGKCAR